MTKWLTNEMPKYWKFVIACLPVAVFVGTEVVQAIVKSGKDGSFSKQDFMNILISAVTALLVYFKRNKPMTPKPKKPKKRAARKIAKKVPAQRKHRRLLHRHRRRQPTPH